MSLDGTGPVWAEQPQKFVTDKSLRLFKLAKGWVQAAFSGAIYLCIFFSNFLISIFINFLKTLLMKVFLIFFKILVFCQLLASQPLYRFL